MTIPFKKTFQNNLYSYLYVSGHVARNKLDIKRELEDEYLGKRSNSFQGQVRHAISTYLSCTSFIMSGLEKYTISDYNSLIKNYDISNWRYKVLANDFDGMGVDQAFRKAKAVFFEFDQSLLNSSLFTEISILGMRAGRRASLLEILKSEQKPELETFLEGEEIFADIVQGRDYGYFNSFLLKSKYDLDDKLNQFFNAIEAGN